MQDAAVPPSGGPSRVLRPVLVRQKGDQERRRSRLGKDWVATGAAIDRGDSGWSNPDTLSSSRRTFGRRTGIGKVRFHDLRHAHATVMLLAGAHPKVVSERLGHASVGITLDIYSHVLPSMQEEAALAFDGLFGKEPA